MKILNSLSAALAFSAVLGLGYGAGSVQGAHSAGPTCRGICTIEYQECLAVAPPYGSLAYCRPIYLRCIRDCPR